MKEYSKQLALELQDKYNLPNSYLEDWERENQIPFFFSQNRAIEKSDSRVQQIIRIHSHIAVNSSKLAHKKSFVWNIKQPIQKRLSEIEIELELIKIEKLKQFLSTILDLKIENSDSYKKEFEKVLFDSRIMYSKITPTSSYNTFRRRWKAGSFDKVDIEMLHTEHNALQKLYNELFPTQKRYYSVSINVDFQGRKIDLQTPATSKEDAFKELKKMPFGKDADFSVNDIRETEFTYDRNREVESTFDYLPDTDEDSDYIDCETDPTKFV